MNKNKAKENSLCSLVQEIVPLLDCSASVARVLDTVENFESNIQNLEARIDIVQQEVTTLIAEQSG